MNNLNYQSQIKEPLERRLYLFFGHTRPTQSEELRAVQKKTLLEDMPDRIIDGLRYNVVKVTLADGWENAE